MYLIDKQALKAVSYFSGIKDIRYYLNGVCVKATPNETRLIATNGHTLAVHRMASENSSYLAECIIPTDTVKQVLAWKPINKHFAKERIVLTIGAECRITWGEHIALFKPIDGKFPDYTRVIPKTLSGEVAQFQADYIARCQSAREALGGRDFVSIGHNGESPALVDVHENMAVVLMPFRGSQPDADLYQWARTDLPTKATEVTAHATPDIAAMIDPRGALQKAGLLSVHETV